jgi:hypothetical protein
MPVRRRCTPGRRFVLMVLNIDGAHPVSSIARFHVLRPLQHSMQVSVSCTEKMVPARPFRPLECVQRRLLKTTYEAVHAALGEHANFPAQLVSI